jgi:hypothetical protein
MSKRFIKIMSLFKLANEESPNQGIMIDRDLFLQALNGSVAEKPVKIERITA